MIVEQRPTSKRWYHMYDIAEHHFKEHGNLNVSADYIDPNSGEGLGRWLVTQRSARRAGDKKNKITPEQIEMLDRIGMDWGKDQTGYRYAWDKLLGGLKQYKQEYGDCNVHKDYETKDGYALGKRVVDVRSKNKKKKIEIPEDVRKQLDDLGFVWDTGIDQKREESWMKGYNCLKDYFMCGGRQEDITAGFVWKGYELGKWMYRQTGAYREVKSYDKGLYADRYNKLVKIGFSFALTKPRAFIRVHDLDTPSVKMPKPNTQVLLKYTVKKDIAYREAVWENGAWYVDGKKISDKRALAWAEIPKF